MATALTYAHISSTPGICGGRPRVGGYRIRVQDIAVAYERQGHSPEEICQQYPLLSLAQVHAALAYYFDHRDAILADLREDERLVQVFKQEHPESVR